MHRAAKQVTPREIATYASGYYFLLGQFGSRIEDVRPNKDNKYILNYRLGAFWPNFIESGLQLSQSVMGSKEIPDGQTKKLELAIRVVMSARRMPKDPVTWFDKNLPLLNFLYDAATKWPDKAEGESEQKFQVGPFTVHNTMGLTGNDLESLKAALNKATQLLHGLPVHGIAKVLYGDVMIVGKLQKGTTVAWYYPGEDVVYVRPFKSAGFDELHSIIHELGHRYLHKFINPLVRQQWHNYHIRMTWSRGPEPTLPAVGDALSFGVKGIKGTPIVQKIEDGRFFLTDTKFYSRFKLQEILRKDLKFPTAYSAKSDEEHFCEALALKAMDKLKRPHLDAFIAIVEEGGSYTEKLAARRIASGYIKQAMDSTWADDEIFSDRELKEKIKEFLTMLIREGKAVSNSVDQIRQKAVKEVTDGDKLTDAQMVAAAMKLVEAHWGDDAMAKPLARLIALGDYVW